MAWKNLLIVERYLGIDRRDPSAIACEFETKANKYYLREKFHPLGNQNGHSTGQHCEFHAKIGEELVTRQFTPISIANNKGYVDFMIKIYFKNDPNRPEGGTMSPYLDSLKVKDSIQVSGPAGTIIYNGRGKFCVEQKPGPPLALNIKKLGLVAGGVGITPVIQILRTIACDPADKIECSILYASKSKKDVLYLAELDDLVKTLRGRAKLFCTIEDYATDWPHGTGIITKDILQEHLFPPSDGTLNLVSGPWSMLQAMKKHLNELRYGKNMYSAYF